MSPKVYTRKGDDGTTALADGTRVGKDDARAEAYGTVDELVSFMGLARTELVSLFGDQDGARSLASWLRYAQERAMEVASLLAGSRLRVDLKGAVLELEGRIDEMSRALPELRAFLVPGQNPCESLLHVARCVCRRAERGAVRASAPADALSFLNRLSDFLFTAARYVSAMGGDGDVIWRK